MVRRLSADVYAPMHQCLRLNAALVSWENGGHDGALHCERAPLISPRTKLERRAMRATLIVFSVLLSACASSSEPPRTAGDAFRDCAECPEMVVIPAGSFDMGDNGSTHKVALKAFAMGRTEVTQGQWQAVMGSHPSIFRFCGNECPVENISWDDAQAFIQKLSAKTGKT